MLPRVETAVDDSDVAIRQEGIVGRDATAERAEDGRIALNFVPQSEILKYAQKAKVIKSKSKKRHLSNDVVSNKSSGETMKWMACPSAISV